MRQLLATGRNHLLNVAGKSINKKAIVFESDDWGSIRMPSRQIYDELQEKGVSLGINPYNKYDSLETSEDLEALYSVLRKFSDGNGQSPVITTNFIMANPDFDKIAGSGFESYFFESFRDTYLRHKNAGTWEVVQQGMSENLIRPQFHGREHLNVHQWLNLLRKNNPDVMAAFLRGVFCLDVVDESLLRSNMMAAFDYRTDEERVFVENSIVQGLGMFADNFGFASESMIAPCNVWGDHAEEVAAQQNVKFIQSLRGRCVPKDGKEYDRHFPVTGQRNAYGQHYLVRNVYFEPATHQTYNWISNALLKIDAAFFWKKPAIISMHRLNFIGSLDVSNRTSNLEMLGELLNAIVTKWPDVEFMSSDQLGRLYNKKKG